MVGGPVTQAAWVTLGLTLGLLFITGLLFWLRIEHGNKNVEMGEQVLNRTVPEIVSDT